MQTSYHVHSTFSDGKNSLEQIYFEAQGMGLNELGFSDHYVISPHGKNPSWAMFPERLEEYFSTIHSLPKSKTTVRIGLEVDFYPEMVQETKKNLAKMPLDYVIGAVHNIEGYEVDRPKEVLPPHFCEKIIKKYWIQLKEMALSKTYDIVAHMDLTKKHGLYPTVDISKEIEEALEAIANSNMSVEVNTAGLFSICKEQYPTKDILKKCKEYGIPILVTADAHEKEHLIRGFSAMHALLHELGFSEQVRYKERKQSFFKLPRY